jgi:hypothetical protein
MPITRRALLISNPGEVGQENYCKGVYVDVKNYQRLLASPEGGAWESNEVRHLDRPNVKDVREWLAVYSSYDYVFVLFTGHGWYSYADRDRILELRKDEHIASVDLVQGAKKRTIILDCCQKVHPESLTEKRALANAIYAKAAERRSPDRTTCRKLFDNGIQEAPSGIIKVTSCATGEISTDDDYRGGRYSGSLIECADDWSDAQAKDTYSRGTATISISAMHECAADKTRKLSGNLQNPTIEKPRTSPYFPISVFG